MAVLTTYQLHISHLLPVFFSVKVVTSSKLAFIGILACSFTQLSEASDIGGKANLLILLS
jgi:hypothetical protein